MAFHADHTGNPLFDVPDGCHMDVLVVFPWASNCRVPVRVPNTVFERLFSGGGLT
jgi:hypothetical protein